MIMKWVFCLKDAFPDLNDDSGKLQQYSVKVRCLLIGSTKNAKIPNRLACASVLSFLVLCRVEKNCDTVKMK